jgi:hypothetical protein
MMRDESPDVPGEVRERSRPWLHNDIGEALKRSSTHRARLAKGRAQ